MRASLTGAVLPLIAVMSLAAQRTTPTMWHGPYRGFNAPGEATDQDLLELAATGANIVRLGFPNHPLMNFTAPYGPNEAALQKLDHLLDVCERAGLRAIIDPHTAPGFTSRWAPFTTMPQDPFWDASLPYQDAFVAFWGKVARRYKDRGEVIAGYDLLNEPNLFDQPGSGGAWNKLVRRMIQAIRAWDTRHTIIIEPPIVHIPGRVIQAEQMDTLNREGFLEAWPDANVVYSPHFYIPWRFTAQGLDVPVPNPVPKPIFHYPGMVDGVWYDRGRLESLLNEVAEFQHRHGVPIYIGEFSTTRWLGEDGNRWLADAIRIFERFNWSWAYHAWREWQGWDAEMSNNPSDLTRHASTPRLELLKSFFARNASGPPPARRRHRGRAAGPERLWHQKLHEVELASRDSVDRAMFFVSWQVSREKLRIEYRHQGRVVPALAPRAAEGSRRAHRTRVVHNRRRRESSNSLTFSRVSRFEWIGANTPEAPKVRKMSTIPSQFP